MSGASWLSITLLCWLALATPGRVIDGDTFEALVAVWPSFVKGQPISIPDTIRILGVNTPETETTTRIAGEAAKAFTRGWLAEGDILLGVCERDSTRRALATVSRASDGASLGETLLRYGHAVPFKR